MDETLRMNVIDNMMHYLNRRRMTQKQLATKCGLSYSTISRILNGHHSPDLETCQTVASVLGIDPPEDIFKKLKFRRPKGVVGG